MIDYSLLTIWLISHTPFCPLSLFFRARAQFIASHSAMERFLRPDQSNWSATMSVCSVRYILLQSLRWIMMLTFLATTLWSSLYLIEVFAESVREGQVIVAIGLGFVCTLMTYSLWSTCMFTLELLVKQCIPLGPFRKKVLGILDTANDFMAQRVSSKMCGIDTKDTGGGKTTLLSQNQNDEVIARLERMEKTIELALAHKVTSPEIIDNLDDSAIFEADSYSSGSEMLKAST
jgi:hypothetical protein